MECDLVQYKTAIKNDWVTSGQTGKNGTFTVSGLSLWLIIQFTSKQKKIKSLTKFYGWIDIKTINLASISSINDFCYWWKYTIKNI